MPSYAVVGGSRGVGLEFVRQLVRIPSGTVLRAVLTAACRFSPATLTTLYAYWCGTRLGLRTCRLSPPVAGTYMSWKRTWSITQHSR